MKKLFLLSTALAMFTSCYNDSEEALYGENYCDTVAISYVDNIEPIITSNCTSCHSGATPSASLNLDSFDAVKLSALNTTNEGLLNRVQRLEGESGAMPTNYRLTQCQIDQIHTWIDQGALNN
tara:strand:- start:192 stop:560 length:369 start_codon:yes stop_codon:yes gene_type:complete